MRIQIKWLFYNSSIKFFFLCRSLTLRSSFIFFLQCRNMDGDSLFLPFLLKFPPKQTWKAKFFLKFLFHRSFIKLKNSFSWPIWSFQCMKYYFISFLAVVDQTFQLVKGFLLQQLSLDTSEHKKALFSLVYAVRFLGLCIYHCCE